MENWMMIQAGGGVLGLAALGGMFWAFKKLEAPKKWIAMVVFAIVGGAGGFLIANATAFVDNEEEQAIEAEIDDFDAPLDDDF